MISTIVTLIVGLAGGAGLWGFIRFLIERKDDKADDLKEIKTQLDLLATNAHARDLNISKITLSVLMWHSPEDHRAIISEGEHYFLELKGDSWMYNKFKKWSIDEGVNVDYILEAHDNNLRKETGNDLGR